MSEPQRGETPAYRRQVSSRNRQQNNQRGRVGFTSVLINNVCKKNWHISTLNILD